MAVVQNPDLDSISAFTKSGNTVTATVSFTAVYAPSFVTNVNTYAVGKKIYISGAETLANNGEYIVTEVTANSISYTNPNGVTQSQQFALSSPVDVSIFKGVTNPVTVAAATPFSYGFSSPNGWNPPPEYGSPFPTISGVVSSTNTGSTTHIVTQVSLNPGAFPTTRLEYPTYKLNELYPYRFVPSLTLPVLSMSVPDNGNSYLTFDGGSAFSKNNIFTSYSVGDPTGLAVDTVNGILYVGDDVGCTIRKIILSTKVESIIAGGRFFNGILDHNSSDGFGRDAVIDYPHGLALDQTNQILYVSEYYTGSIRKINLATLQVTTERAGSGLRTALGIAFDSVGNRLCIANAAASKITARNLATGTEVDLRTGVPTQPVALAIGGTNLFYMTVRGILYRTNLITNIGGLVWDSDIGVDNDYLGITASSGGNVFATRPHAVYRINTVPLTVSLIAGSGSPGNVDGTGGAARFDDPNGIVYSPSAIYVADYNNKSIRRVISLTGDVTTDVVGTIPSGSNAITISGTTYLYSTPPTITLVPGSNAASYRIDYNGIPGLYMNALGIGSTVTPTVVYSGLTASSGTFDYFAPIPIVSIPQSLDIPNIVDGGSSAALLPFINYQGTTATIAAPQGFPYVPSGPLTYVFRLVGTGGVVFETYSNTITVAPLSINSTPTFSIPFSNYVYTPFSYVFSLPNDSVNTVLSYSTSSGNILGYLSSAVDDTLVNFNSATGSLIPLTGTLTIYASIVDGNIIGVLTTPVAFLPSSLVATQTVPPPGGSISPGAPIDLYKYEAFTYTFTITGVGTPVTLQFTRSSVQLLPYLTRSVDLKTITFTGTPPASYAGTFNLVIDLISSSVTVPSSVVSYPVTISPARLVLTPPSPYFLDKFTNISNTLGSVISITAESAPTNFFSTPGLPSGLSFSGSSIVGTPQIEQPARNYLLTGSNSTTTNISTANISIRIGPPAVRILPSSVSFTNLTTASIQDTTFISLLPDTLYLQSFMYVWDRPLPSGLVFKSINGVELPYPPFSPSDSSRTIMLSGSPNLSDAAGFPSSGLVTVTLSGIYTDTSGVQTIGRSTLSFQFAETVLMTASTSSTLYVGKPLGPTDAVVTAASFFPSTSPINSFIIAGLPPEFTVQVVSPTSRRLVGTPLTSGTNSYTATATNANGITKTIALVVTINSTVATFVSPTPANESSVAFIVSRPLSSPKTGYYTSPIRFLALSTSGTLVTYSSSLDFAAYGITFSTSTGELTGTPTSSLVATPVTITATDALGTTATTILNVTISPDTFTFPAPTFTFFQNQAITPYQFVVTTLSERPILFFSGTMPPGLTLSQSGLLTGTFTGTTNSTFTVNASTGYQLPPTSAQPYSYTARPDNLLLLQQNAIDSISPLFSNIQFQTLQYSSSVAVNPTYSFGLYPVEFPSPILTLTSSGLLSGDFTQGPVYSTYLVDITATASGVTSTTPAVITFSNPSTSLLLAGYGNFGNSNQGSLVTTTDYVFTATPDGTRQTNVQQWSNTFPNLTGSEFLYPDIAQHSNTFIAIGASNVRDGVYNPSTNVVDWTETNPVPSGGIVYAGRYLNIASDGAGNWVMLQAADPSGNAFVYQRTGTGAWSREQNGPYGEGFLQRSALSYINGRYVYGFSKNPSDPRANVSVGTVAGNNIDWAESAVAPEMCNIMRFAVSNAAIVAAGSFVVPGIGGGTIAAGDSNKVPISISSNYGSNWTTATTSSILQGSILYDILYAANTWVTCGINSNGCNIIAYSSNLTDWSLYSGTGPTVWSGIAFNGNAWTIAGRNLTDLSNVSKVLSLDASPWPGQPTSLATGTIPLIGGDNVLFSRILSASFSNGTPSGNLFIPPGPLSFVEPVQPNYTLYQYVPYTFPVRATGSASFIFYYALNVPIGFTFVQDPTGTFATLSGISPSNGPAVVSLYAKIGNSAASFSQVKLTTIIPYFTNQQIGAAAYTAIVRDHVEADAAQNARDSKVFPEVNPLAGPFMAPRAPDVTTMSNCFLGLCRKPCPTCRTTL